MTQPTVSVIMPTYNHAAFVRRTIESVLSQQGVDFEFLIEDDGSTDQTREVVASVEDERIHFVPNEKNRGAAAVTNSLIERASGEFVALINSDDFWNDPDKLACQVQLLRDRPKVGACFGRARFVDRDGQPIDKSTLQFGTVFDKENRSQSQWLRHFFLQGNCICHPTMLIRRSCYEEVGMYNNRMRQLPDFDMWVRLLKKHEIFISDRELISFRHLPGQNAGGATENDFRRNRNELYFVLRTFFDQVPDDLFREGFSDLFINKNASKPEELEIEKAFLYLRENRWTYQIYGLIGLERVFGLLNRQPYRDLVIRDYNLDDLAFQALNTKIRTFDPPQNPAPPPANPPKPHGNLSSVQGSALIAEVARRCKNRLPKPLRSAASALKKRIK
jgi:glycosyltransferase involved in cell wall biosynthesis